MSMWWGRVQTPCVRRTITEHVLLQENLFRKQRMGWRASSSVPPSMHYLLCNRLPSLPSKVLELLSAAFPSLGKPTPPSDSCNESNLDRNSSLRPDLVQQVQENEDFLRFLTVKQLFSGIRVIASSSSSSQLDLSQSLSGFVTISHGGRLVRGFSSTAVQEVASVCWSCEETSSETPFFVCRSCRAIQPLDQDLDFYQLLSVERGFKLDVKLLERKYKNLQKFLHPDLSSLKSEREQGYSADQSAQVIKAYYTLLEPLLRAQYLLKLNGINIDEEGTIHEPALLMEIMELREEVEEANDAEKLNVIKESNKKKMLECETALKAVFHCGDLASAVPIVQRMKYYNKINEEITRKQ